MRVYLRPKEEKTSRSQQIYNCSKVFKKCYNSAKAIRGKKIIQKANVDKEGDSLFQGLRSLLTVLCKFAQGDIASISVDHVTSNAISNTLQNGASGGSILATKLDDLSVTTFFVCCASVGKTVDKHAFSAAELDYHCCYDPNNSNNVLWIVLCSIVSTP